jgi:hypothetical protein
MPRLRLVGQRMGMGRWHKCKQPSRGSQHHVGKMFHRHACQSTVLTRQHRARSTSLHTGVNDIVMSFVLSARDNRSLTPFAHYQT